MKHTTFGGEETLSPEQKAQVDQLVNKAKQERSVPLDHALVLVKHLMQARSANMELETYINEMQAKLSENGISVPSKLKPEKVGDQDENMEMAADDDSEEEDEENPYDNDSDSDSGSDRGIPVPGEGLLE